MKKETLLNAVLIALFVGVALAAWIMDEPYLITLATKAAIFAIAGVGLNFALGFAPKPQNPRKGNLRWALV